MDDQAINLIKDVSGIKPVQKGKPSANAENKNTTQNADKNKSDEDKKVLNNTNVDKMAEKMNEFVQSLNTRLSFSYQPDRNKTVIIVSEPESGKVIRQIPPEEMLRLMEHMDEIAGIIFNRRA